MSYYFRVLIAGPDGLRWRTVEARDLDRAVQIATAGRDDLIAIDYRDGEPVPAGGAAVAA